MRQPGAIIIQDKTFVPLISREQIAERVEAIARQINRDYPERNPLFLVILKGAFLFAADLLRHLPGKADISFVRLRSYTGTQSSGPVVTALGLDESITGRDIIILEDIIDTGKTLHYFLPQLRNRQPASLRVATLLRKPGGVLVYPVHADYVAFDIPDKFVVGYGLDYNGLGRNLPDIRAAED